MNKTVKYIFLAVVVIAALSLIKNPSLKELENVELSNNLNEIIPPLNVDDTQFNTVDFSTCDPEDSFTINTGLGSGGIKVLSQEEGFCLVETKYEIEGGYFINECLVPVEIGEKQFEGNNFDDLASYCQLKLEGNALLELE